MTSSLCLRLVLRNKSRKKWSWINRLVGVLLLCQTVETKGQLNSDRSFRVYYSTFSIVRRYKNVSVCQLGSDETTGPEDELTNIVISRTSTGYSALESVNRSRGGDGRKKTSRISPNENWLVCHPSCDLSAVFFPSLSSRFDGFLRAVRSSYRTSVVISTAFSPDMAIGPKV